MYSYLMMQNLKDSKKEINQSLPKTFDSGVLHQIPISGEKSLSKTFINLGACERLQCNLELKKLNECIKNNKIEKIKCDKIFYDYIKCDELIKIERFVKYSDK